MKTRPRTTENAKLCSRVVEQNGDRSHRNTQVAMTNACTEQATIVHNGKRLATIAIDKTRDTEHSIQASYS